MTAREMIDSLSGTLLCDERILSVPEKELLANLLQRTRTQPSATENAVAEAIARSVGELIAERALGLLGASLTRQLLNQPLTGSLKLQTEIYRSSTRELHPPTLHLPYRVRPVRPAQLHLQSAWARLPTLQRPCRAVHARPGQVRRQSARAPPKLHHHRRAHARPVQLRPQSHF